MFMVIKLWFIALMAIILAGCATVSPDFDEPTVSVTSFQARQSQSIAPQFEIGLHIQNPNRTPLKLNGISYKIYIEGHKVLTGVANKLPVIAAYGGGDVTLHAVTDLFGSIQLITDLMSQQRETFGYEFVAKLDVGGLLNTILVSRKGKVSLFNQQ